MKLSNEDLDEVLQSISHFKVRFVSWRQGPIIDLEMYRRKKQQDKEQ